MKLWSLSSFPLPFSLADLPSWERRTDQTQQSILRGVQISAGYFHRIHLVHLRQYGQHGSRRQAHGLDARHFGLASIELPRINVGFGSRHRRSRFCHICPPSNRLRLCDCRLRRSRCSLSKFDRLAENIQRIRGGYTTFLAHLARVAGPMDIRAMRGGGGLGAEVECDCSYLRQYSWHVGVSQHSDCSERF
jgi:hypothetical protein